jgi:hypothetical protein
MCDLTIAIVNWNTQFFLLDCINSIKENFRHISYEVIIVDNNSKDGSQNMIKDKFPWVILIENKENVGYAKANNQIFEIAKGEKFLLLNPDTLITNNSLNLMINFLDANEDSIVVCPKYINPDGSFQKLYRRWPNLKVFICQKTLLAVLISHKFINKVLSEYYYQLPTDRFDEIQDIEQAGTSCLMLKTKIFRRIGLFDEQFAIFFNDVDLCKRVHNNGYKIFFLPDAEIIHFLGKCHDNKGKIENQEFIISWLRYFKKHYSCFTYMLAKSITFFDFVLLTLFNFVQVLFWRKKIFDIKENIKFRTEILLNKNNF